MNKQLKTRQGDIIELVAPMVADSAEVLINGKACTIAKFATEQFEFVQHNRNWLMQVIAKADDGANVDLLLDMSEPLQLLRLLSPAITSTYAAPQSLKLANGQQTLVEIEKERDADGWFYIKLNGVSIKLQAYKVGKLERMPKNSERDTTVVVKVPYYKMESGEKRYAVMFDNIATQLLDFILQRRKHSFARDDWYDMHGSPEVMQNGFWGEVFTTPEDDYKNIYVYEYAAEYVKTNQELAKEAAWQKVLDERAAAAEKAALEAAILGLPDLKGTAKQVSWALQLRAKYFAKTSSKNLAPRCKSVKTAKWWIEKRFELEIEQQKDSFWDI